ncbi:hypothetical protein MVEG_01280 [Podila verticillata NRRL 6337]|nr:hypothetical protein MVEG_01280 [Podila verticillata NRRL 6337]
MNSNTETWASKVAGKTLDRHGSHPEMSSSDTFLGRTSHDRGHHLANPMRHSGSHATESKYQVAGHDFGGSRPKMFEKEQLNSANEDPMTVFSSMDANRFTPITVIDLDGETSGHLHHNGNHKPYHM